MVLPPEYYDVRFNIELAEGDLPSRFSIITAFNPQNKKLTKEENLSANHSLEQMLRDLPVTTFRATGGSVDMTHSEPGFASTASPDTITGLAKYWHQLAYYWINGDELFLVSSMGGEKTLLDQGFRARVLKFSDHSLG